MRTLWLSLRRWSYHIGQLVKIQCILLLDEFALLVRRYLSSKTSFILLPSRNLVFSIDQALFRQYDTCICSFGWHLGYKRLERIRVMALL